MDHSGLTIVIIWLVAAGAVSPCSGVEIGREDAYRLVEKLVRETEAIYDGILSNKPYDPSLFAWGMHYLARACLDMYQATGNRSWFNKSLSITDYLVLYSDVNADGIPSWGSYNETWGLPRWEFKEYTVWDAVNCLPIIESVMLVRSEPDLSCDPELVAKADAYLELVRRVVERHHPFWTDVADNQGYYWDDPSEDVGPYVNSFTSLGTVELLLYGLTANETYLDRPRRMVNYLISSMRHDEVANLYTWDYYIGSPPAEDLSHGAIDLEFLITASKMKILDEEHILRLCNTYLERIWNVPSLPHEGFPLAMRVDGSGSEDYTRLSRGWVQLAEYVPEILEMQRIALGIHQERHGLNPAGYEVEAVTQIILARAELVGRGIDPDVFEPVSIEHLRDILSDCAERVSQILAMEVRALRAVALLNEASAYVESGRAADAPVVIALIWEAWDLAGRYMETGRRLEDLREEIDSVAELGGNVSMLSRTAEDLWRRFQEDASDTELVSIDLDAEEAELELSRAMAAALIAKADDAVRRAGEMGLDTSRQEIFLTRARKEYEKGNYGPAIQFTEYPLRLLEELAETHLPWTVVWAFILPLARGKLRKRPQC